MTQSIVDTRIGRVRGLPLDGVVAFKGVRYAAPPIGPLRFAPPAALEPAPGVVDATELPPSCPQPRQRPAGWSHETREDEDCLFLNVWTPALDAARRPVMVWFHGGGFAIGSGSWPVYDGANLARRGDTVVVTVNHRLGPLGYLHLAACGEGLASSGNVGMQDLVAALRWVHDNIAGFGGDPGNVTIFGESGGGAKVATLLAMPSAKGLFHRAVMQSGVARYLMTAAQGGDLAATLIKKLGLTADDAGVAALRALPVAELLRASGGLADAGAGGRVALSPVLDGDVIPVHPADALRSGAAPDVPLLVGTNFDEATLFLGAEPALLDPSKLSFDALPARLAPFGARRDALLAAYRANRPDATAIDVLLAINSDSSMRIPSIKLVEKKLAGPGSAPAFMYLFRWSAGPLRSAHGFELPFVFDNVHEPVMHPSPSRQQLADRMSAAWLAFARSGDPSCAELPPWPAYDTKRRATMIFDRGACEPLDDPWGPERRVWFESE